MTVIKCDTIATFGMLALEKEKKETVLPLHSLPENEKNLDLAQALRRNSRNAIYFNYSGSLGSKGEFLFSKLTEDAKHVMDFFSSPKN